MVVDVLSTTAAVTLALLVGWSSGPTLGRWSRHHRLARFSVGLLTEMRMLPILVALVPVVAARSGLMTWLIIGSIAGASRAAAVARWMNHAEPPDRVAADRQLGALGRTLSDRLRLRGAAGASLLEVTFEVALIEGLSAFFSEGRGIGLGAALGRGQYAAVLPLVGLAAACVIFLERSPARFRRRAPG